MYIFLFDTTYLLDHHLYRPRPEHLSVHNGRARLLHRIQVEIRPEGVVCTPWDQVINS